MNAPLALTHFQAEFVRDLRFHHGLCEEVMSLVSMETEALANPSAKYQCSEFAQKRKDLLPRLGESLMALRKWRQRWQEIDPAERAGCCEVRPLFQAVQGLLMKILLRDRENQQALLRHGLMPAPHLPSLAAQQSHCVADRYRRHSRR